MRFRMAAVAAAALVLVAGGCAKPRPCLIIPRQIEMARYDVTQAEKRVSERTTEVQNLQGNIEMNRTRLGQLEQEASDLQKAIDAAKADSIARGGKK
jgi:hypothetical protein